MLGEPPKGNLSLFPTNTDGCRFKRGLVLVKHDKVRDDTQSVTKVWRSSNASVVAPPSLFSNRDNLLFMYQLPIKRRSHQDTLSGPFVLLKLTNGRPKEVTPRSQPVSLKHDLVWVFFFFLAFVSTANFGNFVFKSPFDAVMNHKRHCSFKRNNKNRNN